MEIISIRNGFTSDHSSTSYEFLAVDKALGKKERNAVASLSSRADPTSRRVSFTYNVDGYDIPGGWESLMENYYDIMYREEYGWWTLALGFQSKPGQINELKKYEFTGEDDLGTEVSENSGRIVVVINCRVDMAYVDEPDEDYYDNDEEEEELEDEEPNNDRAVFVSEDPLLNLLVQVRNQLIDGDYRVLYALWEKYRYPDEEEFKEEDYEAPPAPSKKAAGSAIVEQFINMLE